MVLWTKAKVALAAGLVAVVRMGVVVPSIVGGGGDGRPKEEGATRVAVDGGSQSRGASENGMATATRGVPTAEAAGMEYFILGDVARPGVYSLAGRTVTTKQALASAGVDEKVPATLTIIRRHGTGEENHAYDVQGLMTGSVNGETLEANDVLQVTKK
jgi:hypothetical protein